MNINRYLGFTFAVIAMAVGLSGIYFLSIKPDLPFEYLEKNKSIESTENYSGIVNAGDKIIEINGQKINELNQVEFFIDLLNIGDEINIKIKNPVSENSVKIKLDKAYKDGSFIYISSIIGFTFWFLGFFVFIKKPDEISAKTLFVMLLFFAVATMTSPGKNNGSVLSYYALIKTLHLFAYIGGISFLIHFSLIFPRRLYAGKFFVSFNYILLFSFCVLINIVQLKALASRDIIYIDLYHMLWTILLFILLSGTVLSIVNFCISFFLHKEDSDRRRVQWALWGMLMGVMPYIFLWVIPNLLDFQVPIKEEYSIAFFIFIPVSFVIGVSKYKLFDIEYIFSKSIVYFTVTVLITAIFFFAVYVLSNIFSFMIGDTFPVYSFVSALFIAIIFNPLRIRIQKLVDKYFFRIKYDFKKALNKFNNTLAECNTIEEIGDKLLSEINDIIPNKESAILLRDDNGELSRRIAGINIGSKSVFELLAENKDTALTTNVSLVLNPGQEIGKMLLGQKLSGIKYLDSDYEILKTFAVNAITLMNRIELREQVIRSEIEKKRLEEINEMKSEFVSSVSHELKTPLTSIQIFAETLLSGKEIKEEKLKEYAGIIYGESERLTRMINNILDFSKIERGIKQYYFENICVNSVLENVLNSMEYQFAKKNALLVRNICSGKIIINADSDAVSEAVINLLSNAIKYSGESPKIEISLNQTDDNVILSVKDNGKGIDENEFEKIFEKFYRIEKENEKHIGGAGIGLALVKNIMTAHNGDIKVESESGKGSTFSLIFKNLQNQI